MRFVTILAVMLIGLGAANARVYTQGRGAGQAKKAATNTPKATTTSTPKAKTTSQPAQRAKTTAKTDTRIAKANTRAAKTTAKADTRVVKNETKAARNTGTTPTAVTTSATPATTTVVTPTTPITRSVKNPKLEARLLALLPPGMTIQDASQGFKNWGQFVAATHASNNLNIPFVELKARMTGITPGTIPGSSVQTVPMSLGQTIQSFKSTAPTPDAGSWSPTKVQTEVKKAEDAANIDLSRTREIS